MTCAENFSRELSFESARRFTGLDGEQAICSNALEIYARAEEMAGSLTFFHTTFVSCCLPEASFIRLFGAAAFCCEVTGKGRTVSAAFMLYKR
jgi:hypothetical protein